MYVLLHIYNDICIYVYIYVLTPSPNDLTRSCGIYTSGISVRVMSHVQVRKQCPQLWNCYSVDLEANLERNSYPNSNCEWQLKLNAAVTLCLQYSSIKILFGKDAFLTMYFHICNYLYSYDLFRSQNEFNLPPKGRR